MRLGTDPEIFLVNESGKHIAVSGLIKAGKHNPLQIPGLPHGYTLQEDNVALEYGIPPASSAIEFIESIGRVVEASKGWLPKGVTFSKLSCTIFEDDQLTHPGAQQFGCEPDYCVYTGKPNPKPVPPYEGMRSAGGHIHIETPANCNAVVRAVDLFLGVPSVLMDKGKERKQLYGKAGAFRYKPYGVEYRTLSNFWIFTPQLIDWVWRNTDRALNNLRAADNATGIMVRECIDNDDEKLAHALVNHFNLEVAT